MNRLSAADIICIGAQRAMTSWLHRILSVHPDTSAFPNCDPITSTSKEAHYWDWNHHRGQDWYRILMRPLNDAQLSLDFTPEYAFMSAENIAECRAINPTAKIIYILRDPLARAISAIRMRTMWATQNASADEHQITFGRDFLYRCQNAQIWQQGAYAANVQRWRAQYPDLLLVNYEHLQRNPMDEIKRIFDHCQLSFDDLPAPTRDKIQSRSSEVIWKTHPYQLDSDCLYFLHGVTWPERNAAESELGMRFEEGADLRFPDGANFLEA